MDDPARVHGIESAKPGECVAFILIDVAFLLQHDSGSRSGVLSKSEDIGHYSRRKPDCGFFAEFGRHSLFELLHRTSERIVVGLKFVLRKQIAEPSNG